MGGGQTKSPLLKAASASVTQITSRVDKAMSFLSTDRGRSLVVLLSISVMLVVITVTAEWEHYTPPTSAKKAVTSALKKSSLSPEISQATTAATGNKAQKLRPANPDEKFRTERNQAKRFYKDYVDSRQESFRFFHGISNEDWQRMKHGVLTHRNHKYEDNPYANLDDPSRWYKQNFDPHFSCMHERRISNFNGRGDGGKWVCDPHRIGNHAVRRGKIGINGCLIYSFDYTLAVDDYRRVPDRLKSARFESAVNEAIGSDVKCEIHVFDPFHDPREEPRPGVEGDNVYFHPWGLVSSTDDSLSEEDAKHYKTFQETVAMLGHERHLIDILSLDCAGCEWKTYRDWLNTKNNIGQILVEVHGSPKEAISFFTTMQEKGYVTFHKESTLSKDGCCYEYSFLRMHKKFFKNFPE